MKIIRVFLGLFAVCCLLAGCASSSPAVSAIMKHDVNGLKKILDSGVSPNFVEDHEGGYGHGESLLAISFNSGYDNDASRLLLDRGADLAKSKALYTSIIAANSLYGETPDIKSPISLLLEKGVNPNQKLDNGISIIHAACSDPKNMRVLISNGANTNDLWIAPTNEYSQTPLSACLLAADKVEREIIEFRNTLSSPYYSSDPSIMRSAIDRNTRLLNRNIDSVLILLDSGANPNTTLLAGVGGKTAPVLNFAISSENLRVVRAMLDHGADPMAVSEPRKRSALHIAAEFGYEEIAKLLINSALASAKKDKNGNQKFRSWLNGRFNNEMTALHFAAKSGSADLFQILINAGADASVKDNNGYTAQIYLDQKLEADRASKLAAQSVVDAKRRERSEAANASGFQWEKFTAMAAGAAIGGIDKMSSDLQVKMATGIIQDSMAGQDGMGNTKTVADNAKASMNNGGSDQKSAGDPSNAADRKAKAKACANEYDGPNDDPQTDTYCKLAAYDACLHRAGITEGDQSGRASCHTLNGLLEATGSKYTCRYCPYPF